MRLQASDPFACVRSEGGLLPADVLARIAADDQHLGGLTPGSYHLAANERLNEAITRSWNRLLGAWRSFVDERARLPAGDPGARVTRERWLTVLFSELNYGRLHQQPPIEVDAKAFPVFCQWQHTPIHLVGAGVPLDRRTAGVRGAAGQSPHSLVQELLNRSPERLWGIVSNGLTIRLLRDNVALTRQAYVEWDLQLMMDSEAYSDFVLLWLVLHQSRVEGDTPEDCRLEHWSQAAADDGTRALDGLRDGVQHAIELLGAGFLAHPANAELHRRLRAGELAGQDYYRELLRLVYRLLFLFVAEDRDALLDPAGDPVARDRYLTHYATRRLRRLAGRRRGGRQHDLYVALDVVMGALHEDGCAPLALPALGSRLWAPGAIGALRGARLANADLLEALRELAYVEIGGVRRQVDFRNLGAEELGSIYESLLELHPELDRAAATFALHSAAGSERKTTGSYYTPTSLIVSLLDSSLDPVLDAASAAEDPEAAILALTVCDPACGSGHFLLAAANRIARRLAEVRAEEVEPGPREVRRALRDVIGHCLYGVDVNPMAVELCQVSLWLEALEPGTPLSFLDHRIVVGNSLLGATPALLAEGIPDAAFKPILGDTKTVCATLKARNRREQAHQTTLDLAAATTSDLAAALAAKAAAIDAVDDHSLAGVHEQERRHRALVDSPEREQAGLLADAWCAAFVGVKAPGQLAITQDALDRIAATGAAGASPDESVLVTSLAERYAFLHWHVVFPAVFRAGEGPQGWDGGFDIVLGNPPWERVKLQEKEFFATRAPEVALAGNKAQRQRLIDALVETNPALTEEFEAAKRQAEGESHLLRDSGRYPLCGRGDVNTYAVFAEQMRALLAPTGRSGVIVPTGIATDDTTKHFFADIVDRGALVSLYDFENREAVFPGVHRSYKFCLLTLAGAARPHGAAAEFVFFALHPRDLDDPERRFTLSADDIALLNPNTKTCPIFRSRRDAEITKGIYRRVPVLVREGDPDGNPWGIRFSTMFHMSNDSHLFRTRAELEEAGWTLEGNVFVRGEERYLPLYEGRLGHQFNHRFATQPEGVLREVTMAELADPDFVVQPQFWVTEQAALERHARRSNVDTRCMLGFRRVARNNDERTVIAAILPFGAASYGWILTSGPNAGDLLLLAAAYNSFALDYLARSKLSQPSMPQGTFEQIACPRRTDLGKLCGFLQKRVSELVKTARDLDALDAIDDRLYGWDVERRANIRAELDAAFFHLYGLPRDDVDYILDTFPIVRRKDEQRYGEYRTKRLILEAYDAMAEATATGTPYVSPLDVHEALA